MQVNGNGVNGLEWAISIVSEVFSMEQTEELKKRIETIHQTDSLHSQSRRKKSKEKGGYLIGVWTPCRSQHTKFVTTHRENLCATTQKISPFLLEDMNIKYIFPRMSADVNSQIISSIISASQVVNARCSLLKITRQSKNVGSTAVSFPFDCCRYCSHKPANSSSMNVF